MMQTPPLKYMHLQDLGSGSFGVAKLMRNIETGEMVAVKLIPRCSQQINGYVERELLNHRSLRHPHIVQFKEAYLTPTHLAIAMEYAAGGELFEYLNRVQRFSENEARYFFQQLVSGLEYCHSQGVCHRDLKLENLLLDGSRAPRLKICDFGYSKHAAFDSGPKSIVGTRAYIAPEVILMSRKEDPKKSKAENQKYDGQAADVWSCGVILYLLLVGAYPFEDPADPNNFQTTIKRIMTAGYHIPPGLPLSAECLDLLSRMLVVSPQHRITVAQIKRHPFFMMNLPAETQALMMDNGAAAQQAMPQPRQTQPELEMLIREARKGPV